MAASSIEPISRLAISGAARQQKSATVLHHSPWTSEAKQTGALSASAAATLISISIVRTCARVRSPLYNLLHLTCAPAANLPACLAFAAQLHPDLAATMPFVRIALVRPVLGRVAGGACCRSPPPPRRPRVPPFAAARPAASQPPFRSTTRRHTLLLPPALAGPGGHGRARHRLRAAQVARPRVLQVLTGRDRHRAPRHHGPVDGQGVQGWRCGRVWRRGR